MIPDAEGRALGAQLLHLLIEGWPRLKAATAQFHSALLEKGHEDRQALVFATALAVADITLTDVNVDRDHAELLTEELSVDALPDARLMLSDQDAWLQRFASSLISVDHTPGVDCRTIADWLGLASRLTKFDAFRDTADRVLAHHGVLVVRPKDKSAPSEFWIAARNPQLERLHAGSKWKAEDGVGRWTGAAQRLPGAYGATGRLAGPSVWGTKLPLALIVDDEAAQKAAAQLRQQSTLNAELDANGC